MGEEDEGAGEAIAAIGVFNASCWECVYQIEFRSSGMQAWPYENIEFIIDGIRDFEYKGMPIDVHVLLKAPLVSSTPIQVSPASRFGRTKIGTY